MVYKQTSAYEEILNNLHLAFPAILYVLNFNIPVRATSLQCLTFF